LDKDGQENSRKKESGTVQIEMSGWRRELFMETKWRDIGKIK
jgi:hypothetical protein